MVRFILNYLIFSVATIRVCKKMFSCAFSFDKSCIKNELKESENHEDNQDFFSCKGVYKVSPHFPLLFPLGNMLILSCGEKRLSWKQWPGAWDSLIVGCGKKSLGLPEQPRLQGPRSWKGVPAEKQNWNCAICRWKHLLIPKQCLHWVRWWERKQKVAAPKSSKNFGSLVMPGKKG